MMQLKTRRFIKPFVVFSVATPSKPTGCSLWTLPRIHLRVDRFSSFNNTKRPVRMVAGSDINHFIIKVFENFLHSLHCYLTCSKYI